MYMYVYMCIYIYATKNLVLWLVDLKSENLSWKYISKNVNVKQLIAEVSTKYSSTSKLGCTSNIFRQNDEKFKM